MPLSCASDLFSCATRTTSSGLKTVGDTPTHSTRKTQETVLTHRHDCKHIPIQAGPIVVAQRYVVTVEALRVQDMSILEPHLQVMQPHTVSAHRPRLAAEHDLYYQRALQGTTCCFGNVPATSPAALDKFHSVICRSRARSQQWCSNLVLPTAWMPSLFLPKLWRGISVLESDIRLRDCVRC